MSGRRMFLKKSLISTVMLMPGKAGNLFSFDSNEKKRYKPLILSTWRHGRPANDKAWEILHKNGSILDAVEGGVRVTEADPNSLSVGLNGLPDRDGIVTLDASIMKGDGSCGAVAYLRRIKHPISLARKIMEETPHILLSGEGALQYAIKQGFTIEDETLSPRAKKLYDEWVQKSRYQPQINAENHDTIGMIGLDSNGQMAGACTTSGIAFKMHGRVGDSPIIGAGLYVDENVGAATATGLGESILRVCGSFLIVELMRQGRTPQEACEEAIRRLAAKSKSLENTQVGFLALNKEGQFGAFSLRPGFNYAINHQGRNALVDADHFFKFK
ncbi:N(4)-(beta-N-acetylglucosaminyl)-L-asparaginase [Echinicola jeungdonensis]|uniref:N(4)-(Beta-N-acetylglucosaminyl)-L-asparaginase n=1 Tax=Echinicola jeungdonensis TaxID=709343 RepID=A0ABV5J7L4_9BACT|nr:N(4)-(beta-N-acetylglucosaminyl)-L-asparaginase [Echinicola jeungdonensis]MDN3668047.1 N(4)-(beta-N-acetylglucosaminyl)-L-asparaginase [Echinicola jeungdonensis]